MPNSQGIRKLAPYLVVLVFFTYKLTHLNISFFWDESWVYAPALQAMAENGPSLLPDAISLDYSRGHPLLFHFLGGLWIKTFGNSFFSMHFFALAISTCFLFLTNALLQKLAGWTFSTVVLILLCVQAIFVAQASMVLPEMLLATLSMACIYFYLEKKLILYLLFGILTVLTKETGILVLLSIVLYDFLVNLKKRESIKEVMKRGFLLCLPLLTLIGHMLYLKSTFGWYLYPEHTGLIKTDFLSIFSLFVQAIHDQIEIQGRFMITIPFVILYAYKLLTGKNFLNIILLVLTIILALFTFQFYGKQFPFSVIFIVFLGHYALNTFHANTKGDGRSCFLLFAIFVFAYCLFSAANFYTVRYLMSTFPYLLIVPIYYILHNVKERKWAILYFVFTLPVFISILLNPSTVKDINLSYLDYCPLQLEVVEYFENNNLYEEQINTMFLMSVALKDQLAGYRQTELPFTYVNKENGGAHDYYIFYNVEDDQRSKDFDGELVKRLESGQVWFEIWKTSRE